MREFQYVMFILFQGESPIVSSGMMLLVIGFVIGVIVGIIIAAVFNRIWKSIFKSDTQQPHTAVAAKTAKQETPRAKPHVSLCPVCHTSYTDPNLRYCLSDGSQLFLRPQDKKYDSEATLVSPKI
jgi:MFS superfamily sulfate permease-like transporter